MTFKVIKWVKGYSYLYEQSSKREGKRVISQSTYIGPVSGGFLAGLLRGQETRPNLTIAQGVENACKVSSKSLFGTLRKSENLLRLLGGEPDGKSRIIIARGNDGGVSARRLWGGYTVTAVAGQRKQFWQHYRQALGRSIVDTLERQKPQTVRALREVFDPSLKAQRSALIAFLRTSDQSTEHRYARQLAITGYLAGAERRRAELGLSEDFDGKLAWKDDLAGMLADHLHYGGDALRERSLEHIKRNNADQRDALASLKALNFREKVFGKGATLKARLRGLTEQEQAQTEYYFRLQALRRALGEETW